MTTTDRFLNDVRANRFNCAILERWDALALPDGWLVAGCLFQTVWNLESGAPPEAGIRDYDLFYFDPSDLSQAGEQRVQGRVDIVLADLGVVVEAKNQARVHLWYPEHFGFAYPRLASAREAIDRFLVPATCVGIQPQGGASTLYAPHGLDLLYQGRLTRNPLTNHESLFVQKAQSYQDRWPWLSVEPATGQESC